MSAETVNGISYVEVPWTSCLDKVDSLGWGRTIGLMAGGDCLGVRLNSEPLAGLVERLFAGRVATPASPPSNYSLRLATAAADGPQQLHALYRMWFPMLRTRSARRPLEALWQELDSWDARAAGDRLLVEATVLSQGGRIHLLPASFRHRIVDEERRWTRAGLQLVDRRWVEIDPVDGVVVLPPIGLEWDADALAALAALDVDDRPAPPQPTGRLPIASWSTYSDDGGPASRVVEAAGQVLDRAELPGARWLQELAALVPGLADAGPRWRGLDDLRHRLRDL